MKVRVHQTIDASDDYRRAINLFYGLPGMATRAEIQNWIIRFGSSMDDDLMFALNRDEGDS